MIVEDSQLSLAIGKKGQNVRLASKLIGWRIDIKSEEEKRAEIEDQIERMQAATPLEKIEGLTPGLIKKLIAAEITTVEQLADLAPEDLEALPGIGGKTIDKIRDELSEYYAALPTYQDDLERSTQEAMFSKSVDEPALEEVTPEAAILEVDGDQEADDQEVANETERETEGAVAADDSTLAVEEEAPTDGEPAAGSETGDEEEAVAAAEVESVEEA